MVWHDEITVVGNFSSDASSDLADYISSLSEKYWCAGWLDTCAANLWDAIQNPNPYKPYKWGFGEVSVEELEKLYALYTKYKCWYDYTAKGFAKFTPKAWRFYYAKTYQK